MYLITPFLLDEQSPLSRTPHTQLNSLAILFFTFKCKYGLAHNLISNALNNVWLRCVSDKELFARMCADNYSILWAHVRSFTFSSKSVKQLNRGFNARIRLSFGKVYHISSPARRNLKWWSSCLKRFSWLCM